MMSLAVTLVLSSISWCTKSQKSGQVYHIVLPREAYYSSWVSRVCVASVIVCISTDTSAINVRHDRASGFRAAQLISPLSRSSISLSLKTCYR